MTELEPYLCLCERQDWNNPLRYQHNAETGKLVINLKTAKALGLSAVKRGANLIKITDVTGHKSFDMLKTYSRDAEAFVGHAGAGLL
jgi:hypothetical protein